MRMLGTEMPVSREVGAAPRTVGGGRYRLGRRIGEGGRKRVYLAEDTRLEREVAVALIKLEGLDDTGRTRARREAQALARLDDHPNIVTVHDVGDEEGQPYLVTQYVAGGDLTERIRDAPDHTLAVADVLRIGEQLCEALAHAHTHGIVHRDLKPANVWLTTEGTVKLGDFGVALRQSRSRTTVEGMLVGTVAYMSPEQALGRRSDARSDLYALGAVLYELLTGRPPFTGDDPVTIISQHIHSAPVAPSWHNSAVPPALDALILRLLAKAPEERPASATLVQSALAALTPSPSSTDERGPRPRLPAPPAERNRIAGLAAGVFVGRTSELEGLRAAVEETLVGTGRVILLAGEPGIGKTSTAREVATYAELRGMRVRIGRCHEGGGAPAYWPWIQILRTHLDESAPQDVRTDLGPGAVDFAHVLASLRSLVPELPPPSALDPEQARFRFLDGVTTFFKNTAARQPLFLVLDDLHWADPASLRLLEFMAREIPAASLLLLVTYREEDVEPTGHLFGTIASLSREPTTRRMMLHGLTEAEVAEYIDLTTSRLAAPAVAARVIRDTEGNPFFVGEVVRLLAAEGRLADKEEYEAVVLPPGVRDVIRRRLDRLPAACRRVLTTAAIAGRDFELRVLATCEEADEASLVPVLQEAVAARVIAEVPRAPGSYSFVHALIRETLYQDVPSLQRALLHRRLGAAIEAIAGTHLEPHLDRLAYHFSEAGPIGDLDKAIDYATRAGDQAMRLLAYEAAAAHYSRALDGLERREPRDDARCCEVLLMLGEAWGSEGEIDKAKEALLRAAGVARELQDPERLARAALGCGGRVIVTAQTLLDDKDVRLLEEALSAFGSAEGVLCARVMARLAGALPSSDPRRGSLARRGIAMARQSGDAVALAQVLWHATFALWVPDNAQERLAFATEMVELAETVRDLETLVAGHLCRFSHLLEVGDVAAADGELQICTRLADESRQPRYVSRAHRLHAMRALLDGRFDEVEELIRQAMATGGQELAAYSALQLFMLHLEQGRLGELEEAAKNQVAQVRRAAWEALLPRLYVETGRHADAQRELDRLGAHDFSDFPWDINWDGGIMFLSDVCTAIGDSRRAGQLYDLLRPHAERFAMAPMTYCWGSVSRTLGSLAATMGRWDDATRHFEDALDMNRRIASSPWVAHTQHEYAAMLLTRAAPGDRDRALALLAEAVDTAERLGMKALLEKALSVKLRAQGVASADVRSSIDTVAKAVQADRPDLRTSTAPDGTVTLLFSDIQGFTALTSRLGDRAAHDVLTVHNDILRDQVTRHGGFEVKALGDGFMVAFAGAQAAVFCAVGVQRALAGYAADHPEEPIRIRIGLHTGEVLKEGADFFGTTVNMAARIADKARGGEILVSALVKELVEGVAEVRFGHGRKVHLKGLASARLVFPVRWSGDAADAAVEPSDYVFRLDGEYWTVVYEGEGSRLKDAKGLHQIATLLAHPGQEFHVLDLIADAPSERAALAAAHDAPGAALDAQAKRSYRQRLAELRAQLDEAERFHDTGRAERARAEMESLTEQLASAVGLGGRDRRAGAAAERARSTLGRRIRWAIRKVAAANPALGHHLTTSIKTGYFCSYSPDPTHPIAWDL